MLWFWIGLRRLNGQQITNKISLSFCNDSLSYKLLFREKSMNVAFKFDYFPISLYIIVKENNV